MPCLKLSNPFRRDASKPSPRERFEAVKASAARVIRQEAADPHIAYCERLIQAHAEYDATRPIYAVASGGGAEALAVQAVASRFYNLAREVLDLPPPKTSDGLAVCAIAFTLLREGATEDAGTDEREGISLARAVLSTLGVALPPSFIGFGDEPDFVERDRAHFEGVGRLPERTVAPIASEADAPARPPVPDLSNFSINDLRRAFDALSAASQAYGHGHCSDEGAAGSAFLDDEGDRVGFLRGNIADELEGRRPANLFEQGARSDVLAGWALACGDHAEAARICLAADAWRP